MVRMLTICMTLSLITMSSASLFTYDLIELIDKKHDLDCEQTDFMQLFMDYDGYGEIVGMLQENSLEQALQGLQEISQYTTQILKNYSKQFVINPKTELDTLMEKLKQVQGDLEQSDKQFFVEQCEQVKYQITRCYDTPPEYRRSQLSMLRGLIDYLLETMNRLKTQTQEHQITQQVISNSRQKDEERSAVCSTMKYKREEQPKPQIKPQPQPQPKQQSQPKSIQKPQPQITQIPQEVVCEDDRPQRQPKCVTGSEVIMNSSFDQEESTVESEVKQIQDVDEYGFGFWMRFLQLYPGFMKNGLLKKDYSIGRIIKSTKDEEGDRLLSMFQNQDSYVFGVQNKDKQNTIPIEFGDIEGAWTYVYYSYSVSQSTAIGFYYQVANDIKSLKLVGHQEEPKYLKFILGGKYGDFPGFNGQLSRPVLKIGLGTFLTNVLEFQQYALSCNSQPIVPTLQLKPHVFIKQQVYFDVDDNKQKPLLATIEVPLAEEYAVSGWFKWDTLGSDQATWHTMFRLANTQLRKQSILMGERVLAAWLGKPKGGQIHLATYSYSNMRGGGNSNAYQYITHNNMHLHWHYIYFGYNRALRKAYAQVQFKNGVKAISFINVNHYLAPKHYFYYGKEKKFPSYNGLIAYLEVFMCKGAYQSPVRPSYKPAPTPLPPSKKCIEGPSKIMNAQQNKGPVVKVELTKQDLKDTSQYGFGFWFRYLNVGVVEKTRGDWSLVAKFGVDKKTELLTILQGKLGYFFKSFDVRSKKFGEAAQPFNDIEGVWSYTYFSYSKGVAYAYYIQDCGKASMIKISGKHPRLNSIYFQIGGKDDKNPGFSGQFSRPVLRLGYGTFFQSEQEVFDYVLSCNHVPQPDCQAKGGLRAISKKKSKFNGKPITTGDKFGYSDTYGVQGWFKWNGAEGDKEQVLVRLASTPKTQEGALNSNILTVLFDPKTQTLSYLTYSYSDSLGSGDDKVSQTMEGKSFAKEWFHIYFAYNRIHRQADVIVEHAAGKGQLTFTNVNHYITNTLYLFYGKDDVAEKAFDGWIFGLDLMICDITYSPAPKPPEQCDPQQEPLCLAGNQYEVIHKDNIEGIVAGLEKNKPLIMENQFVPEQTQCFCYMSSFRDRQAQLVEMSEQEEEEDEVQIQIN